MWLHASRCESTFLRDLLRDLLRSDSIYIASNVKVHNLEPIAAFLGQVGRPALGGLPLQEFKRRHRLHGEAEMGAQRNVAAFIEKGCEIYGYDHFVNDTTDSFCELEDAETDPALIARRAARYSEIAARHGYTVDARQAAQVENESDFLELVGSVL